MIDNIEIIKPLLGFKEDWWKNSFFIYLQVLQRKKQNPQLGSNSRVIKNYYIYSEADLDKRYEEIKELCNHFNARAMIRLIPRCNEKIAFKLLENVANNMSNKDFKNIRNGYDRACGLVNSGQNKTWILDIDYDDKHDGEMLISLVAKLTLDKHNIAVVPSQSGLHLITKPFDTRPYLELLSGIDIHKDNPTNLYIP